MPIGVVFCFNCCKDLGSCATSVKQGADYNIESSDVEYLHCSSQLPQPSTRNLQNLEAQHTFIVSPIFGLLVFSLVLYISFWSGNESIPKSPPLHRILVLLRPHTRFSYSKTVPIQAPILFQPVF